MRVSRIVRMLLKQGYRHVYVSRPFALKHGLIPKSVSGACEACVGCETAC